MIVMGLSGVILTFYRIPTFASLLETRFGILLIIKIILYLLMVFSALFVITIIGPRLKAKRREPSQPDASGAMTLEDLA
jgi:putative copper export protein